MYLCSVAGIAVLWRVKDITEYFVPLPEAHDNNSTKVSSSMLLEIYLIPTKPALN